MKKITLYEPTMRPKSSKTKGFYNLTIEIKE